MRTGWTGERPALGRRRRRRAQLQQANEAQRASALAVDARETPSGRQGLNGSACPLFLAPPGSHHLPRCLLPTLPV